ncbi:amino acid adenylation domain-containing protein [Bacillus sp. FSL W7-1360]
MFLSDQIVKLPEEKRGRLLNWMKEAMAQTSPQERWVKRLQQWPAIDIPEVYKVKDERTEMQLRDFRKEISATSFVQMQAWARQQNVEIAQVLLACLQTMLVYVTGEENVALSVQKEEKVVLFPTNCSNDRSFSEKLVQLNEGWNDACTDTIEMAQLKSLCDQIKKDSLGVVCQTNLVKKITWTPDTFFWDIGFSFSIGVVPEVVVQYRSTRYSEHTIRQLVSCLEVVIEKVVASPSQRLSACCLLDEVSYEQLTEVWPVGPNREVPANHLVQQWLKTAQQYADRPALTMEDEQLTYREVEMKALQLAHYFQTRGVSKGDRIGIYLPRSVDMVVAVLSTLIVGGTYVPLDPTYPKDRLHYMINDAHVTYLVTESTLPTLESNGVTIVSLDLEADDIASSLTEPMTTEILPTDWAYIIYTSGSTGEPKGVPICHRSVVNFIYSITENYEMTKEDRILQFASLSFDVSVFDIFSALLNGAELVIASDMDRRIPQQLADLMMQRQVTVAELPPAILPLLDAKKLPHLRLISVGGEMFPGKLVENWATPTRRFMNGYGPTETTVAVTVFECSGSWAKTPPIGRPIANHQAYVLNEHAQPVPIGSPGELCISGVGLSDGYLNAPDKTAERFIDHPFQVGARLYRTGDLVRWLPDGNLEILGRTDRQVKIRGFRIELGEIESVLLDHPAILEVAVDVIQTKEDDKYIAAYVILDPHVEPDPTAYRAFLEAHLPKHMVPTKWVQVKEIPLTPNGKLDRQALSVKQEGTVLESHEAFTEPVSETEAKIAKEVFAFLLDLPRAGTEDNFFDLGGNSLQATKVVSLVKDLFGVEIGLIEFFQKPTVKGLSQLVTAHQTVKDQKRSDLLQMIDQMQAGEPRFLKIDKQTNPRFRLVCFHYAGGSSYVFKQWQQHVAPEGEVILVELPGHGVRIQEPCLESAEEIAAQLVPELTPLFDVPVALLGHSMGALVAFETSCQLVKKDLIPAHLFVAASRAPQRPPKTGISQFRDDIAFLNALKQFGGLPEEVMTNHDLLQVMIPAIRADVKVSETYSFHGEQQLNVPFSIFGATTDHLTEEELRAWGELTTASVDVQMFDGDHFFLQQQEQKMATFVANKVINQLKVKGES